VDRHTASEYIRANFRDDDKLAVVLIRKRTDETEQRVASAARIASEPFQAWLRYKNREKFEVYVSMNALHEAARGRRKSDIGEIRHVYLDFDKDGPAAVEALKQSDGVPPPNHVIESSPGKYQVVWRVENFDPDRAENLMRGMVRHFGADPAATDSSRVLRLPSFFNHKYERPHFVTVQNLTDEVYQPANFAEFRVEEPQRSLARHRTSAPPGPRESAGGTSQSERDWAFAMRALARGDDPEQVARAIEANRQDKPDPRYYAEYTVEKALAALHRTGEVHVESGSDERSR